MSRWAIAEPGGYAWLSVLLAPSKSYRSAGLPGEGDLPNSRAGVCKLAFRLKEAVSGNDFTRSIADRIEADPQHVLKGSCRFL